MISLKIIDDKKTWEEFIFKQNIDFTPFFQSWNWGDLQSALGNSIYRFGIFKRSKLVGICLAVEINAKRGHYLHLRHGPILENFNKDIEAFIAELKKEIAHKNIDFIRLSPLVPSELIDNKFLKQMRLRNAPVHNMDAENAWVLDLNKSDEVILKEMRKTTRYLIHKAEKMEIKIIESTDQKDMNKFLELYKITSKRHKFVPHRGMKEELEIFSKDNQAKLYFAEYKNQIIAGSLIIYYGNQAVYHHAATDDLYRDVPGAYLLQWEIIKKAKEYGKKYYNFWGVVPENRSRHPWKGLTLFKTGFGGKRVNFVHAQDLPLRPNYLKTFLIEKTWKFMRGY